MWSLLRVFSPFFDKIWPSPTLEALAVVADSLLTGLCCPAIKSKESVHIECYQTTLLTVFLQIIIFTNVTNVIQTKSVVLVTKI